VRIHKLYKFISLLLLFCPSLLRAQATGWAPANIPQSQVISLFTGTCNSTTFLRGDGACAATGGGISGLTTNTLPKATSGTTIGDSSLSDPGTTMATTENFNVGATQFLGWTTSSQMYAVNNGEITMTNNAANSFTGLNFGPRGSSFPSLRPTGTTLALTLANGTAGGTFSAPAYLCGITGTTGCIITGSGGTSGTGTIAFPLVAGTASNPVTFSNGVTSNSQIIATTYMQVGTGTSAGYIFNNGDRFINQSPGNVEFLNVGETAGSNVTVGALSSFTNCSSGASPAVCGSAVAGSVAIPAGALQTLQINTTAVTANSQILLTIDSSLGTKLGVTCNTTVATLTQPVVTLRSAGASVTIEEPTTTSANPVCVSYLVVN
jgi:hypothetical protein